MPPLPGARIVKEFTHQGAPMRLIAWDADTKFIIEALGEDSLGERSWDPFPPGDVMTVGQAHHLIASAVIGR